MASGGGGLPKGSQRAELVAPAASICYLQPARLASTAMAKPEMMPRAAWEDSPETQSQSSLSS